MGSQDSKPEEKPATIMMQPQMMQPEIVQPIAQEAPKAIQTPLNQIQNKPELPPLKVPPGRRSTNKFKKTKDFHESFNVQQKGEKKTTNLQNQPVTMSPSKGSPTKNTQQPCIAYPSSVDTVRAAGDVKPLESVENRELTIKMPIHKTRKFRPSKEE